MYQYMSLEDDQHMTTMCPYIDRYNHFSPDCPRPTKDWTTLLGPNNDIKPIMLISVF